MRFSLRALNGAYRSEECYYLIENDQAVFSSPFYPDKTAATEGIKTFIFQLRTASITAASYLVEEDDRHFLQLFGEEPTALPNRIFFDEKGQARELLTQLRLAAQQTKFQIIHSELTGEFPASTALSSLDQQAEEADYDWAEVKTSTLHLDKKRKSLIIPALGLSTSLGSKPCDPLFNLFQPCLAVDLPYFRGRKKEVEELYNLTSEHRLLLMYGLPRVGKTSLIQCGLVNKMEALPGQLVMHRIGETGMIPSLCQTLREEIEQYDNAAFHPEEEEDPFALLATHSELVGRPIHLVFDQLEVLFEPTVPDAERNEFFVFLNRFLDDESLPHRIILSLREAFLAPLADYEELLPNLMDNRYHLHPLNKASMLDVSVSLLDMFQDKGKVDVEDPHQLAGMACEALADEHGNVPFHCMEIYLSEMQQEACARSGGQRPLMNAGLANEMGSPHDVIENYLNRKQEELEPDLLQDDGSINPLIKQEMEELKDSRRACGCSEAPPTPAAAATLIPVGVGNRNMRSMLWIALLALLLSLFGLWYLSNQMQSNTPCSLAKQEDSCEAYLNYLCTYGDEAACSDEFHEELAARDCEIYRDYQALEAHNCELHQAFYNKYRDTGVCLEEVQRQLLEWECPMVRDTVELTVRDTIIERLPADPPAPTIASRNPRVGTDLDGPGCETFAGTTFKQVGPLWVMTDPLPGGPFRWEDALAACQAQGLRLPCIGEIDFLISDIYRASPDRAFDMLTGSDPCKLVDLQEVPGGRISFWTGTEANDALSWSYYFDSNSGTIGRESNIPKTATLPCLCVRKDVSQTSSIPPCYNKRVDRQPGF
ncbi:MAG: ATP-binding protein [Bacteroidota bacterium]